MKRRTVVAPFSSSGTVGTEFPPADATAVAGFAFPPPFLFWARSAAVLSAADDEAGMTCKRAAADLYELFTQSQGKQKSTHTHAVNMSS